MPSLQDLSLRQLEYAVAVADTLGFHKAAARCHVSQPTLSAQIQQLEDVLGVRLFERDRRGVLVTAVGAEVVARARRVLVEVEDILASATRASDPLAATYRVGVIPTIAPYFLPEVTPALAKKYPNLRLVFREEKTADLMRHLEEGKLDAGLVALEAELGADVASAVVCRDAFVLALPQAHPLAKKKKVTPDDLEDEPVLLLDDGHCFRDQALAVCARAGAEEAEFRATSLATLVQMVSTGAGVTLLPSLAVDVENRRGQMAVRPFADPVPSRTIALVWRPRSPYGEAFGAIASALASVPCARPSRA